MIEKYRISKIAGPSMIFSGWLLFIFGVVSIYFTWTSSFVILGGAAIAFSNNSSFIDFDKRRYKPATILFGIWPLGSWVDLEPADALSVVHFQGSYTTYSRSNRASLSTVSDYRLILHRDADGKKIPLAAFKTKEEADALKERLQS